MSAITPEDVKAKRHFEKVEKLLALRKKQARENIVAIRRMTPQAVIENLLPAYVLELLFDHGKRNGLFTIREDVVINLQRSQAAVFGARDDYVTIAEAMERDVGAAMRGVIIDNIQTAILGWCWASMRLVEEEVYDDKTNVAVLYSIAMWEEARQGSPDWSASLDEAKTMGDKFLGSLRALGYFTAKKPAVVH